MLAGSFELIAQADEGTELRDGLRRTVEQTRLSLAAEMLGLDVAEDPERVARAGTACHAILSGLIVQWLVDPVGLPDPAGLAEGLLDVLGPSGVDPSR